MTKVNTMHLTLTHDSAGLVPHPPLPSNSIRPPQVPGLSRIIPELEEKGGGGYVIITCTDLPGWLDKNG